MKSALTWTNPVLWIFLAAIFNGLAAYFTLREQDRQTHELRGWMTGGDSFAYFEPLREPGRIRYFIRQTGTYPAYDVVVRIHDEADRLIEGPIDAGTISGGSGRDWLAMSDHLLFRDPPQSGSGEQRFRIELQARNGITIQRIRVWPYQGRWHTESKDVSPPFTRSLPQFKEAQEQ